MLADDPVGDQAKIAMEPESPLNAALRQFEAVEANLGKLERLWSEGIRPQVPTGLAFFDDVPEYDRMCKQYEILLASLPAIDGWKPLGKPMALNDIARNRFDAQECGEPDAMIGVEEDIETPARELREYRFRFDQKRRALIRDALLERIDAIDGTLRALEKLLQPDQGGNTVVSGPDWDSLNDEVAQIQVLIGSSVARPPRWGDFHRHLAFAQMGDLYDIIHHDWPAAKEGLRKTLYGEQEPVPVGVVDLGSLVSTKPKGTVITRLQWERLTEEDFERLIFALISSEVGYVNPQWLTKTSAADRGRDMSVTRTQVDGLSGSRNTRIILQCKHWLSKSVALPDVATLAAQMKLWEPPRVDEVAVVTSGRFTTDAISFIEQHNQSDHVLRIEMWPESHLENVLAKRPGIIAQFKLR